MQQRGSVNKSGAKKRLLYLDLTRGMLLVFIIINHVPYAPKLTDILTGDGALISTAAEGFFLLSGLMVAYLYLPKILSNTKTILGKIWRRAGLLYILSILTTLIFTIAALILKVDPTSGVLYSGNIFSLDFFRDLLSFQYIYGWTDFLARYAVFMLFAPAALFLIAYRKTWLLIALSLLVWFVSPVIGVEHFSAWQVLFFAGMIIGSKLDAIILFFNQPKNRPLMMLLFAFTCISLTWSMYVDLLYPAIISHHFSITTLTSLMDTLSIPAPYHEALFSKELMPLPRIAISIIWFLAALILFSRNEAFIEKYTRGLLSYLGRNSLVVYVIHSFVIFFIFIIFTTSEAQTGIVLNTLIGVATVTLVYWLSKIYLGIKNKPKA